MIAVFVMYGTKLESLANLRENRWRRNARARRQRADARAMTLEALARRTPTLPISVTIRRFGPRLLDSDNLAISAKHVRDGVADSLGIDDGDERVEWRYFQEKRETYDCEVEIATRGNVPIPPRVVAKLRRKRPQFVKGAIRISSLPKHMQALARGELERKKANGKK